MAGLLDQQPPEGGLLGGALANREAWNQSGNNPAAGLLGQYVDWQKNRDFNAELSNPGFWTNMAASFAAPIRAYHGSPYSFDKFDLSKVGTGEGAQAYGHGLYFAENPQVAQQYRRDLSGQILANGDPAASPLAKNVADFLAHGGNIDEQIAGLSKMIASNRERLATGPNTVAEHNLAMLEPQLEAFTQMKGAKITRNPGSMYEVDIHADPHSLLDWDKPLSEQAPQVRRSLNFEMNPPTQAEIDAVLASAQRRGVPPSTLPEYRALEQRMDNRIGSPANPDITGGEYYRQFGGFAGAQARSQGLNEAGIPGIRYLDQGSRGVGTGSANIVAFDPSIIEILRKYGLAGPLATGGLLGGGEQ